MSDADRATAAKLPGRGTSAVVAMLTLAVVAAAFAWYVNFNRGRRTLEFFGSEAAMLIRTAPKVELVVVPDTSIDMSKAPGLLNARTSLLNDASYDWMAKTTVGQPGHALRFSRDEKSFDISFDLEHGNIQIPRASKVVKLRRKTADGWRAYLERQGKAE